MLISFFLRAFVKLRKATISFVRSVRLSTQRTRLSLEDFNEILHLSILRKSVNKIQVDYNLTGIIGALQEDVVSR